MEEKKIIESQREKIKKLFNDIVVLTLKIKDTELNIQSDLKLMRETDDKKTFVRLTHEETALKADAKLDKDKLSQKKSDFQDFVGECLTQCDANSGSKDWQSQKKWIEEFLVINNIKKKEESIPSEME